MQNAITQHLNRIRFTTSNDGKASLPGLSAVEGPDTGCGYTNGEFTIRAADLLLSMDSDQFENMLHAAAYLCKSISEDAGDPAFQQTADLLTAAARALNGRMGN